VLPSHPVPPAQGTLPSWFSLDGILDEVRLFDRALSAEKVARAARLAATAPPPDIPPRVLPSGPAGPGRFGAYYTRLRYYEEWDAQWPVAEHPDVVVQFDGSPVRVVSWRGLRYSPAWVTENGLWLADQSGESGNDEGSVEHMQDIHTKYSHVRIIESSPARAVVHWRYAPVSGHDHNWPVSQVRSDGRFAQAADHATSFSISQNFPTHHREDAGFEWVAMLYGATFDEPAKLVPLARSWMRPPELRVLRGAVESRGYDVGQRAYPLRCSTAGACAELSLELRASPDSPLVNALLVLEGFGDGAVDVSIGGQRLEPGRALRTGYRRTLDGTDLLVWPEKTSTEPVGVRIALRGAGVRGSAPRTRTPR
jgi:hypothetical protein